MTDNTVVSLDHYREMYELLLALAKERGFSTVEAAICSHQIKGETPMTCIKTGARVHFTNYGQVLAADLFAVENTIVVRVNRTYALETHQGFDIAIEDATHEVCANPGGGNEFWRDDLGVFVVPACNIRPVVKEAHDHRPMNEGNTL